MRLGVGARIALEQVRRWVSQSQWCPGVDGGFGIGMRMPPTLHQTKGGGGRVLGGDPQ